MKTLPAIIYVAHSLVVFSDLLLSRGSTHRVMEVPCTCQPQLIQFALTTPIHDLIETIVVPLADGLSNQSHFLEKIRADSGASNVEGAIVVSTVREINLNELAKPRAVVVAKCSRVSKALQKWIGLQNLTLYAVFMSGARVGIARI